jgi:hypothetical protein
MPKDKGKEYLIQVRYNVYRWPKVEALGIVTAKNVTAFIF